MDVENESFQSILETLEKILSLGTKIYNENFFIVP